MRFSPQEKRYLIIGLCLIAAVAVPLALFVHNAWPATATSSTATRYRIVSVVAVPASPGNLGWRITMVNPTTSVIYAKPAWNFYAADGLGRHLAGTNGIYGWPPSPLKLLPRHRVGYTFMIGAPDLGVLHPTATQYCVISGASPTNMNGPRSCVRL
ncbi:MAG: hypothetical protein Q7R60_02835 [bacterium]|nr:hypothetical protein [bacterium]